MKRKTSAGFRPKFSRFLIVWVKPTKSLSWTTGARMIRLKPRDRSANARAWFNTIGIRGWARPCARASDPRKAISLLPWIRTSRSPRPTSRSSSSGTAKAMSTWCPGPRSSPGMERKFHHTASLSGKFPHSSIRLCSEGGSRPFPRYFVCIRKEIWMNCIFRQRGSILILRFSFSLFKTENALRKFQLR